MSSAPNPLERTTTHRDHAPPWWRAVLIGSLLVPVSVWLGAYIYLVAQAGFWGATELQLGSVSVLFVIAVLTLALRTVFRRLALQRSELLLIYAMLTVSVSVGGGPAHMLHYVGGAQYFATPENQWEQLLPAVPRLFIIDSWPAILGYYEATTTLYSWPIIRVWLLPVGYGCSILILLLFGSMLLTNLVGRQWVEHERLAFPLVQVPLEMTQVADLSGFWRNRIMWVGFAIPAVLESVNCINYLYPSLPRLPIRARDLAAGLTTPPLSYIKSVKVAFYPFVIGVAFLLTTEMSFSCWFFWLLRRVEWVVGGMMGFVEAGRGAGLARLLLTAAQGQGALLGFVLLGLWIAWGQIRRGLTRPWRPEEDHVAIFSPTSSLLGLGAVIAALVLLLNLGNMPPAVSLPLVILFFLFNLSAARVVSEAGAVKIFLPGTVAVFTAFTGVEGLPLNTRISLAYTDWWGGLNRGQYTTHLLAALKMRHEGGIPFRFLRWGLALSMVVTVVSSVWIMLHIYYDYGATSAVLRQWWTTQGKVPLGYVSQWKEAPYLTDWIEAGGMLGGALVTGGLSVARQHIYGWPFHPAGYVLAFTGSMNNSWMPFFLAWFIKTVILRYFGIKTYQWARPFFLGVIMGDFVTAISWGTYGMITRRQMYLFWHPSG